MAASRACQLVRISLLVCTLTVWAIWIVGSIHGIGSADQTSPNVYVFGRSPPAAAAGSPSSTTTTAAAADADADAATTLSPTADRADGATPGGDEESQQEPTVAEDAAAPAANEVQHHTQFDVVYLWVNGTDPAYAQIRRRYSGRMSVSERDRDNGELRYSLRSLDRYMPWWRGTLYIVADKAPCWLKAHGRVRVVSLDSLFPDPTKTLPTLNTLGMEAVVYRIPGLRKHFVLMHDDMFLGAPVQPSDFFVNGRPVLRLLKDKAGGGAAYMTAVLAEGKLVLGSFARSRNMLAKLFTMDGATDHANPNVYRKLAPAPYALDRDLMGNLHKAFPVEYHELLDSRVPDYSDFHAKFLHHHYCLMADAGCLVADDDSVFTPLTPTSPNHVFLLQQLALFGSKKFLNINDAARITSQVAMHRYVYADILPAMYPTPSQWEVATACPLFVNQHLYTLDEIERTFRLS